MAPLARILIFSGIILILAGGLVWGLSRTGLPLGRLPGDIRIQTDNLTCLIPLATSIILSILLTVILNIVVRLLNK